MLGVPEQEASALLPPAPAPSLVPSRVLVPGDRADSTVLHGRVLTALVLNPLSCT